MKVCLVHNEYGKFSGEEAVVASQSKLLEEHGQEVCRFTRSSNEMEGMVCGQMRAFLGGIYNPFSARAFRCFLVNQKPELIHIHNLYPLISPAVLHVCKDFNVPVVMTLHNYRLICPNGLFMVDGTICERCRGGREYWCFVKNCEYTYLKSLGYAMRNYVARFRKSFMNNIHIFAALTDFQRQLLVAEGYTAERIELVPNMSQNVNDTVTRNLGDFISYVGRFSKEKGVEILLEVAEKYPQLVFKAAGSYENALELVDKAPENFHFLGHLARHSVDALVAKSRIIVLCSICYEGFPVILVEAMMQGRPVVASRIGGIPEIVEDGVTGLLFDPGDPIDLAEKIQHLWDRPSLCRQMGEAGRVKALREYSSETYYERLMGVYQRAENICKNEA